MNTIQLPIGTNTHWYGVPVYKDDKRVMQSRNLRAISDYGRKHHTYIIAVTHGGYANSTGGECMVTWSDGAQARALFADHKIMLQWIAKKRIFKAAVIKDLNAV